MQIQADVEPYWAAITVWVVVNALNTLQGAGFLSRFRTGGVAINHTIGYLIIALSVPATVALVAFVRAKTHWLHWSGPASFVAFVLFLLAVDYLWPVEFRSPMRPGILIPFLVLFFGSIFLMGLPMYLLNRLLWLVTIATTVFLVISMGIAMQKGVG